MIPMNDLAELHQIEADARKFAAQFSGFMKAAEMLARIGNLEQATSESERRLAEAKAAEDQYFSARDNANLQKARELDAALVGRKQQIELEASAVVEEAKHHADTILNRARADAAAVTKEAGITADRANAQATAHQRRLDVAIAKLAEIADEIRIRRDEQASLTADVETLSAKRAEIVAHIEALKAKF